jgi:hypothetical protein
VAVDEHDPAAAAIGIASEHLVERLGDDGARRPFDARPDALVAGLRTARLGGLAAQTVQDIRDGAAPGLDGVNRRDLRHALAVLLLARPSTASQPSISPCSARSVPVLERCSCIPRPSASERAKGRASAIGVV